MRRRHDRLPGGIITAIFLIIVLAFTGLLIHTKLIPTKYLAIIAMSLILVVAVVGLLVMKFHHRIRFWVGTVLAVLVTVVLGIGSNYIYKTTQTIDNISNVTTEVAQIDVYVKTEDPAQSVEETADYTYGVLKELDRENTDRTLAELNTELGKEIQVVEYDGLVELIDGILRGETQALILNQAFMDVIEEMNGYGDVASWIRNVTTKHVETVIEKEPVEAETSETETEAKKSDGEIFSVFISGIDNRGGIVARSRSDVNIIATINTETRQVLLVSTPRDYFVPLSISGGVPDKLTHAGIYGVSVCMDTLEMLYDTEIEYYFRVNFGGFTNIIDALGGVTVYSDEAFSSGGYTYNQGDNYMDGAMALNFARERYAFSAGDRQRGKNQMAVINAVINKALSPELLTGYTSVLSGMEGNFETSVPYDMLAKLVRKQLDEGGSWNVVSYSVDGTGDNQKPYSMSMSAYVMIPDQTTVDTAKELMRQVCDGEVITDPAAVAAQQAEEAAAAQTTEAAVQQ